MPGTPAKAMSRILEATTLCAGGLVTDRMLEALTGCQPSTVRAAAFFLRKRGHRINRVANLGYRLVLPR